MASISTKSGDGGETSRMDGTRTGKGDPEIEVYGAIDECCSQVGAARAFNRDPSTDDALRWIQNVLLLPFPGIGEKQLQTLEGMVERLEAELPTIGNFVLPAGGAAAAHLHLARTSARKVERRMAALRAEREVPPLALAWFNRLSDVLFLFARAAARRENGSEEAWKHPDQ